MPEQFGEHQPPIDEELISHEDTAEDFEKRKQAFFIQLGLKVRRVIELHQEQGMLERNSFGFKEWKNVTGHCLVEVARAQEMAELLGMPEKEREELMLAAGIHDMYKRHEKELVLEYGRNWETFETASKESIMEMLIAGLDTDTILLANSVGHGSLTECEVLLKKDMLSEKEIAFLAMHYIDDYTSDTRWVEEGSDPLEERMVKNETNPLYQQLNEDGREHFDGMTTFEKQREVGHEIARQLEAIIQERTGEHIEPDHLPHLIDQMIRNRINAQ